MIAHYLIAALAFYGPVRCEKNDPSVTRVSLNPIAGPADPDRPDSLRISLHPGSKKETLRISVENPERRRLVCLFRDPEGIVLDKLVVDSESISRIYRSYIFSGLEDGEYRIELSDGRRTIVKKIKYWHVRPEPQAIFGID